VPLNVCSREPRIREPEMRPPISQSIVFTYPDALERASRFFREVMVLDFVIDQGVCRIFRLITFRCLKKSLATSTGAFRYRLTIWLQP
jgi:hypothetical protein